MTAALDTFSIPPLIALAFLPFLFLQAVLLHPSIPSRVSRALRFVLLFPAAYFSIVAPFHYRIQPVHVAIGANFRWGIFGPAFFLKALEWGLVIDRSAYTWIGFEEDKRVGNSEEDSESQDVDQVSQGQKSVRGNGGVLRTNTFVENGGVVKRRNGYKASKEDVGTRSDGTLKLVEADVGTTGTPAIAKVIRRSLPSATKASPLSIIVSSIHLITSLRGIGYAFGPPPHTVAPSPPRDTRRFLLSMFKTLVQAHLVSTTALIAIVHRNDHLPTLVSAFLYLFPIIPASSLKPIAQTIASLVAYTSVGISLHAQMVIGFSGISLVLCVAHSFLALPFIDILPPFDSRQYPPLFHNPFAPTSVTKFWSNNWHALFRKPFLAVGYEPVVGFMSKILGKHIGRSIGAFVVFGLSAWMHDQALYSARHLLPPPLVPLTFLERYGAHVFFAWQAVAVILEGLFTRMTGRKVGGRAGRVWSTISVMIVGLLLAGRSWIALGIADGVPEVQRWGWQRWVIPSAALAPPPLWSM